MPSLSLSWSVCSRQQQGLPVHHVSCLGRPRNQLVLPSSPRATTFATHAQHVRRQRTLPRACVHAPQPCQHGRDARNAAGRAGWGGRMQVDWGDADALEVVSPSQGLQRVALLRHNHQINKCAVRTVRDSRVCGEKRA